MSLANSPLPPDPEALRIFAADLQAELARKEIELAANAAEIHAKTLHIEKLQDAARRAGGALGCPAVPRRSSIARSSNLELLIGALEEDAAAEDARANTSGSDRRSHKGRPKPRA